MSSADNPKQAAAEEKTISLSADCWLSVFALLDISQLGLGIALISHRFDCFVDEHFKTRKWALRGFRIQNKQNGENGTKQMEIEANGKALPIPQIDVPRKVTGLNRIFIYFIDGNFIAFFARLRPLFTSSPLNLDITRTRHIELIALNFWPIVDKSICGLTLFAKDFHCLRKFVPSFLCDCPQLRVVNIFYDYLFPEFPADDSAMASDGQALAKWLFTALPDDVPKVFKCSWDRNNKDEGNWPFKIADFKAAFANASSPASCIAVISFPPRSAYSVVPFVQTNEATREQLALKKFNDNTGRFLLCRCPIVRDASKWAKWEMEAIAYRAFDQWNYIDIGTVYEYQIGDGLLDGTPGPSDQQNDGTSSPSDQQNDGTLGPSDQQKDGTPGPSDQQKDGTPGPSDQQKDGTPGPSDQQNDGTLGPSDQQNDETSGPSDQQKDGTPGLSDQQNDGTLGPSDRQNDETPGPSDQQKDGTPGLSDQQNDGTLGPSDQQNDGTLGPSDQQKDGTPGLSDQQNDGTLGPSDQQNDGTLGPSDQQKDGTPGLSDQQNDGTLGPSDQQNDGTLGPSDQQKDGTPGLSDQQNDGTLGPSDQQNDGTLGPSDQQKDGTPGLSDQQNDGTLGPSDQQNDGTLGPSDQQKDGTPGPSDQQN
ncbi:hypothetical protein niasHT_008581 [Heterodera trifolii]|uniref:Uncharacterized protein n=1 Tax=Heterodera trifolii TaxID=157864 RepID=A0ABD2M378_9BILA